MAKVYKIMKNVEKIGQEFLSPCYVILQRSRVSVPLLSHTAETKGQSGK